MNEIIISVQHANQQKEYDLEVTTSMTVGECVQQVATHLGWLSPAMLTKIGYSVELVPGHVLPLEWSLEKAGVWGGAALVFHPTGSGDRQQPKETPKDMQSGTGYQFIQLD